MNFPANEGTFFACFCSYGMIQQANLSAKVPQRVSFGVSRLADAAIFPLSA
ncbi:MULTISPECIES: hypothetical protein [Hymenobacter]|uniref:Uncharacterized protein n=1 Tax=Hymenobacter guriensis TaxID=2793065 RepID=A0ABS0L4G1_9BACT|nr:MULTISPECIES: hypothetical protein [Hymenobacter]MBG8555024.1 hypothetical protein [Hymenobacter guriensis]MCR5889503.1 hypothetical protein [Hymenobacter sp. J193]